MLKIKLTAKFKKDFKRRKRRQKDFEKLTQVITTLSEGKALPPQYKDHPLKGIYHNCRECHLEPDWLLI